MVFIEYISCTVLRRIWCERTPLFFLRIFSLIQYGCQTTWQEIVILMKILFKFQINQMKIDDFRNLAYVDLLADVDLKHNWWLNSVTWYANPLQPRVPCPIPLPYTDLLMSLFPTVLCFFLPSLLSPAPLVIRSVCLLLYEPWHWKKKSQWDENWGF